MVALLSSVAAGFGASACLNRPLCDQDCRPKTTNIFVDQIQQKAVDKIDLLFMIDNSISMADKQKVLQDAVPDLVQRLVNPNCVDPNTGVPGAPAPDPSTECSGNLIREFQPIRNIHVGIITSSIGTHGSALCNGMDPTVSALENEERNDHGYLLGTRPRYMNPPGGYPVDPAKGFLDWNPDVNKGETVAQFTTTFSAMATATGEFGCGLESQLEAIYRFLIDPNPYQQINIAKCPGTNEDCAVPSGKDANLLAQRASFLRSDSLVAIIFLTDENDCSIQESGQYYYAARSDIILPHGSQICTQNPNDKCCYFCNSAPPAGCQADPTCAPGMAQTDPKLDPPNLRCWEQKKRFGFDFLYPTARYVNAFSQAQICTSRPDLAPDVAHCADLDGDKKPDLYDNPLFVGANGSAAIPRDKSLIFVAGIVGVPYQDLQTTMLPDGSGNMYPAGELHYRTAAQLTADKTWDAILGDDGILTGTPPINPTDNLMVESKDPRGGNDGENPPKPLAGPNAPRLANPVNSHEWNNSDGSDLQYACIFPLKAPRDCNQVLMQTPQPGCDCKEGSQADQNPLCQGTDNNYSTTQWAAKGYPGLRELKVLKDFGNNAIVASICAKNLTDNTRQDYGYRPAVDAIVDRLKEALTGKCLPRTLTPDASGNIPCSIIEVRPENCLGTGRVPAPAAVIEPVLTRLRETKICDAPAKPACTSLSLCEIVQAGPTCHKNQSPTDTGWCYVDPAAQPGDDPTLVDKCPATQKRIIRFVDPMNATPAHDATVLIACFGSQIPEDSAGGASGM
jgi:hypothetical protein